MAAKSDRAAQKGQPQTESGYASERSYSKGEVKQAFKIALPARRFSRTRGIDLAMTDSRYYGVDEADWLDIVRKFAPQVKYERDRFDCDDFALNFKAYCSREYRLNGVGLVWDYSAGHMYNCVLAASTVDGKSEVKFIEPQTDQFVELEEGTHYILRKGMVIL